jgi:hypothetical protein
LGTAINHSQETFRETLASRFSLNFPKSSKQSCPGICKVKIIKKKNPDHVYDENLWSQKGKFKNLGVEETWVSGCSQAGIADAYFRTSRPGPRHFEFTGIQKDEERQTSDESWLHEVFK